VRKRKSKKETERERGRERESERESALKTGELEPIILPKKTEQNT